MQPRMDNTPVDNTSGLGWVAALFAFIAGLFNWLTQPGNMAIVSYTLSAIAAAISIVLGLYRLYDRIRSKRK